MNAMKNQKEGTVCRETEEEDLIKYCLIATANPSGLTSSPATAVVMSPEQASTRSPQGQSHGTSTIPRLQESRLRPRSFSWLHGVAWLREPTSHSHMCNQDCGEPPHKHFPPSEVWWQKTFETHFKGFSEGPVTVSTQSFIPVVISVMRPCIVSPSFHDSSPPPPPDRCCTGSSRQEPIIIFF